MVNISVPIEYRILFDLGLNLQVLDEYFPTFDSYVAGQRRISRILPVWNIDPELFAYLFLYIREYYEDREEWEKKRMKLKEIYKKHPDIEPDFRRMMAEEEGKLKLQQPKRRGRKRA